MSSKDTFEKDLFLLVQEGHIWATCPKCGMFLDSTDKTECDICKAKFNKEDIIFKKVDKENTC